MNMSDAEEYLKERKHNLLHPYAEEEMDFVTLESALEAVRLARKEEREKIIAKGGHIHVAILNKAEKEVEARVRKEASDVFLPEQGRRATEILKLKIELKKVRLETAKEIYLMLEREFVEGNQDSMTLLTILMADIKKRFLSVKPQSDKKSGSWAETMAKGGNKGDGEE